MKKSSNKIVFVLFLTLISGFIFGVWVGSLRGIPFVVKKLNWSIGIYTGESPLGVTDSQAIKNPVLTINDVTDVTAESVADPFMVKDDSTWYMFFEVVNADTGQGDIGLATSRDGFDWRYRRIVLDEPFHLSYPYVFHWGKEYYMIPEAWQSNSVRLYRASNFPEDWTFVSTLLNGQYTDSSLFYYNDKWWMFATIYPYDDILYLYYSDNLTGPWVEHPESPVIVGNANIARPGGRILLFDNRIVRFTQDVYPTYGTQVWAFEIMKLTTTSYQEDQVGDLPILRANGKKWNGMGMHQIDPHQIGPNRWIACVDGLGENLVFGLEY